MIITVHQPQFIPWLGYFDKIRRADIFVILDNVQYKKNEWQNRNRIKTAQGWQWLTIPVSYKFPQKINTICIDNKTDWRKKHLYSIVTNYSKAKYFDRYIGFFEDMYKRDWKYLIDINIFTIKFILNSLHIEKEIILSSKIMSRDDPNERLIDICQHLKADTYLAGEGGANYMDINKFEANAVKVIFQKFNHPSYNQLFGNFEPYMSAIDLIFNHGEEGINIIKNANP